MAGLFELGTMSASKRPPRPPPLPPAAHLVKATPPTEDVLSEDEEECSPRTQRLLASHEASPLSQTKATVFRRLDSAGCELSQESARLGLSARRPSLELDMNPELRLELDEFEATHPTSVDSTELTETTPWACVVTGLHGILGCKP